MSSYTKNQVEMDTKFVLNRDYSYAELIKGFISVNTPIFDRLAADRFAKDEVR